MKWTWTGLVVPSLLCLILAPVLSQADEQVDRSTNACVTKVGERILRKEVVVSASVEEVWKAWTTSEGIASFFSPESNIELRVGGPYELFMRGAADERGKRGSEGCKVLSFIPNEMLSFEWNLPPEIRSLRYADAKTHVVLRFEERGKRTVRVGFAQLGWGEGADWDEGYAYFDKAWDWVFGQLKKRFDEHGIPSGTHADAGGGDEPAIPKKDRVYRTQAQQKKSDTNHLKPLGRLVGTWESISRESDGGTFHARVVCEWGLGGKVMNAKSYVIDDNQEHLVYESMYAWHPERETIVFRSVSSWDSLYDGTVVAQGDTLAYDWVGFARDKTVHYRQTIRFLDDDTYEWTVFIETDGRWEQSKQTTFRRL